MDSATPKPEPKSILEPLEKVQTPQDMESDTPKSKPVPQDKKFVTPKSKPAPLLDNQEEEKVGNEYVTPIQPEDAENPKPPTKFRVPWPRTPYPHAQLAKISQSGTADIPTFPEDQHKDEGKKGGGDENRHKDEGKEGGGDENRHKDEGKEGGGDENRQD